MYADRIRCAALRSRITSAAEAALLIQDGMRVGASGFTRAGDAKAVPVALAERVRNEGKPLQITLMTGASLGHDVGPEADRGGRAGASSAVSGG